MRFGYIYFTIILIISWLSLGTAYTDTSGPWVFDKPVSQEIRAAMQRMGPHYQYRQLYGGTLQVSTDKGETWRRLKY